MALAIAAGREALRGLLVKRPVQNLIPSRCRGRPASGAGS